MRTHLALDVAARLVLTASPWRFGFYRKRWAPHVALGLMELSIALTESEEERRHGALPTLHRPPEEVLQIEESWSQPL